MMPFPNSPNILNHQMLDLIDQLDRVSLLTPKHPITSFLPHSATNKREDEIPKLHNQCITSRSLSSFKELLNSKGGDPNQIQQTTYPFP